MNDSERTRPATRLAVPWGLIGTIALVVLCERWFARVEPVVKRFQFENWRLAGRAARGEAVRARVLFFGDSLMQYAAQPRVIEARTGWTAYNLAVAGGHTPTSYFLLRRALRAGARPSAVVVDAVPFGLDRAPDSLPIVRQWPDL